MPAPAHHLRVSRRVTDGEAEASSRSRYVLQGVSDVHAIITGAYHPSHDCRLEFERVLARSLYRMQPGFRRAIDELVATCDT